MPLTLTPIADKVWLFPHDDNLLTMRPNVGVIQAGDQTLIIDAGNSPRQTRALFNAINAMGLPPISTMIYTHHHWDAVFGAMAIPARQIIAHERCGEHLAPWVMRQWTSASLHEEVYRNPLVEARNSAMNRMVDDWHKFRIMPPTITFSRELVLHLDGTTIALRHLGGGHADDCIAVSIREAGVVFISDCLDPPPDYLPHTEQPALPDIEALAALMDESITTVVEGHSAPHSVQSTLRQIDALRQSDTQ